MIKTVLLTAVVTATLLCGCTLSHVAYVDPEFPTSPLGIEKCKSYGDSFAQAVRGMKKEARRGRKPIFVGYKHNYWGWGLALSSSIYVCYEKAPKKAPANKATEKADPG